MSNHFHLCCTDTHGRLPDFMRDLNSLIARGLNAIRGTSGTAIEKGYNLVTVTDEDAMLEHCVYTLANPCVAHLVRRSKHWVGLTSLGMRYGQTIHVKRPGFALWSASPSTTKCDDRRCDKTVVSTRGPSRLPERAPLVLTRPPIFSRLSDEQLRAAILERLDQRERQLIAQRRIEKRSVLGMSNVLTQKYWQCPPTSDARPTTRPRVSGQSSTANATFLAAESAFRDAYCLARAFFDRGQRDVEWPFGTWLMTRVFGCPCAAPS